MLLLVNELVHERSHLWAALRGWHQPATPEDLAVRVTASAITRTPDLMPWPWDQPEAAAEPVDEQEMARLAEILESRGGFRELT